MDSDTAEYLGEQLALFAGGYQHVMIELTAHATGSGDTIPIGVRITDHATDELIAYQVPVIVGNLRDLGALAAEITDLFSYVRNALNPF